MNRSDLRLDPLADGIPVPVRTLIRFSINHPRLIIVMGLLLIAIFSVFSLQLTKDTRVDAFLAEDNPALIYRDKVKKQFGLSDPLVVALFAEDTNGIYHPEVLARIQLLSHMLAALPNIDETRVFSLATEKNIISSPEGMEIRNFLDPLPETQEACAAVRQAISEFPLYIGSIVDSEGKMGLIVLELIDESLYAETYEQIISALGQLPDIPGVTIHVAGEGAISGYLSKYIDADAKRLNPVAWLIIMLVLTFSYRRISPAIVSNMIIAAAISASLGIMALANIPIYMITTAVPVILIGISVADTIHIYSHFFFLRRSRPHSCHQDLVTATMIDMWRPITLTTLTTMAGFIGLFLAAYMPPFRYFGLFAAVGVFAAWTYSMSLLPAAMMLWPPRPRSQAGLEQDPHNSGFYGVTMRYIGIISVSYPKSILFAFSLICAACLYFASELVVDEEPITIFHPSEPIYQADKIINQHMSGTNPLDVVIETPVSEGLLLPKNLRKIEALQRFVLSLPHVGSATSIVDYLKQMNRVITDGGSEEYRLPESKELAAQYLLLYSVTSDPTDFEEEIDYDYRMANVRINVDSGRYRDFKAIVESIQDYIDREFSEGSINATLSGRVNLNYHWTKDLGRSHVAGLGMALVMVWAVSALLFGSIYAGFFTLLPVVGSVLVVYAAMVLTGMSLGIGTSMFAAISVGLGVDFSIHTLDRLRTLFGRYGNEPREVFRKFYQSTGTALLLNFLAIACGFGVLLISKVTSLNNFGGILVVSISASFLFSMTMLPALVRIFQPAFLQGRRQDNERNSVVVFLRTSAIVALVLIAVVFSVATQAGELTKPSISTSELDYRPDSKVEQLSAEELAQQTPTSSDDFLLAQEDEAIAEQVVTRVNEAEDGEHVTRILSMELIDRRGKSRVQKTINYRKHYPDEQRTVLFFLEPANVRDTAFLIWDYKEYGRDDDQWLYLPALRKVRRVSSSQRGDYFLGTDFTYEDMKLDGKLEPQDYRFTLLGTQEIEAVSHFHLEAVPRTDEIASELGYSRQHLWVNPESWVVTKWMFWDTKGKLLKTLEVDDVRIVDGIWTRHQMNIVNHRTGHRTLFTFSDVDYLTPVDDDMFSKRSLQRGR